MSAGMKTRGGKPTPRQPVLAWVADEQQERSTEIALERVGQVEVVEIVAPSRIVTGCGRCGGVYGGNAETMKRYPRRCTCKRRGQ